MSSKKYEELINHVINENFEQADELFHEIVIEKSREIYESIMAEDDLDGQMGGQVGDLLDEIDSEESGITEEDEEFGAEEDFASDSEDEGFEDELEIGGDEFGDDGAESEELEDSVIRIEDKLDQLLAEFESIMGDDSEDEFESDEEIEDFGPEGEEEIEDESEEQLDEAVELQKVPGLYGSKIGGDNGSNPKSPVDFNSGQAGMAGRPVRLGTGSETVPTGPKNPSNYGTKGETTVKGAGSFKNIPGKKTQDLDKAPVPVKTQASGVNNRSPLGESVRSKRTPVSPQRRTKK